jgi:hypothetical protein
MSFTANKLFVLASNFEALTSEFLEKNAKDIEQPDIFEEDYHKWLKRNRKDSPTTVREMKAIKTPPQSFEVPNAGFGTELSLEEPEHEMTHEEWSKKNPKMSDWSDKDWSKYLNKDKNKAEDKPKLDPKASVRNRGDVVFPAESSNVTDHKDHFPLNGEDQARNALAQVAKYKKAPPWYKGSLKSLQDAVSRKVHSKYKGIGKDNKKKAFAEDLLAKYS